MPHLIAHFHRCLVEVVQQIVEDEQQVSGLRCHRPFASEKISIDYVFVFVHSASNEQGRNGQCTQYLQV